MPGVIAVLTGADYVADGLKGAVQRANPAGAIDIKVRAFAPEKRPVLEEQQYPLVTDRVRYPGEAVAVVVAESSVRGARRRRSGRGRIRGAAGGDRRARGGRRRADLAERARQHRARSGFRRCRRGAGGVRRGRSRRRADLRQPAHRQLPDGAALGCRLLRRGGGFLHADFRQPGRPRAAHGAGGKLRAAAGEDPLRLPRRRRRLWAAQQSLSRAGHDPVGGEARRPAGEMDQRPLGILPHRLCGPRSRHHRAAGADRATAASPPITSITSAPAAARP